MQGSGGVISGQSGSVAGSNDAKNGKALKFVTRTLSAAEQAPVPSVGVVSAYLRRSKNSVVALVGVGHVNALTRNP